MTNSQFVELFSLRACSRNRLRVGVGGVGVITPNRSENVCYAYVYKLQCRCVGVNAGCIKKALSQSTQGLLNHQKRPTRSRFGDLETSPELLPVQRHGRVDSVPEARIDDIRAIHGQLCL